MESIRQKQVGELIRRFFGMILTEEGSNIYGRGKLVTVTDVKMTPDLLVAKIYISVYGTEDKPEVILCSKMPIRNFGRRSPEKLANKCAVCPISSFSSTILWTKCSGGRPAQSGERRRQEETLIGKHLQTTADLTTLDIARRRTIRLEAEALLALADSLDDSPDFQRLVEAVVMAPGSRLVITGIGKSAIVAQKIAATLNSTGTPALFLHAADAIHGDLGMVQPADFVICLSKSGETPEIRVLAPLVKNFGNPLVAITATVKVA
jgi:hypothetical protein